jgi:hypothetical protein
MATLEKIEIVSTDRVTRFDVFPTFERIFNIGIFWKLEAIFVTKSRVLNLTKMDLATSGHPVRRAEIATLVLKSPIGSIKAFCWTGCLLTFGTMYVRSFVDIQITDRQNVDIQIIDKKVVRHYLLINQSWPNLRDVDFHLTPVDGT